MYRNRKYVLGTGVLLTCLLTFGGILLFQQRSFASWVTEDEKVRYEEEAGEYAKGFKEIEGSRYYFDTEGYLVTGKFYVEDTKSYYYANKKGEIQTGIIKNKSVFYLADEEGKLQTGFVEYDNNRYYFNEKAEMATGWFKSEDNWYYADNKGVIMTGFITLEGYRYYLNEDGTRVSDAVMEIDGVTYIFNKDGSIDENATTLYPVYQYLTQQRTNENGLSDIGMNSKVQSCAILRAADLKNGYGIADEETTTVESLLKNRGIQCSGGYEFAYGGVEGYRLEQLLSDVKRDVNLAEILKEESVNEVGLGFYQENDIYYYDIIFICKK